jgi:ribosome-binding factor A
MAVDRIARVNELLRREIGDSLFLVLNADEVDLSSLSITQVDVSRDLRSARVMVSILGHENERPRMLAALRRRRGAIQSRINKDLVLRYTPRLTFELDSSVERGDRMLAVLTTMEAESGEPGPPEPAPGEQDDGQQDSN